VIFLADFSFVRIFLKNYHVTMTTTLELHVRKIQWFCQQGQGFCMHVFSSSFVLLFKILQEMLKEMKTFIRIRDNTSKFKHIVGFKSDLI
jgi:hypothetical protein